MSEKSFICKHCGENFIRIQYPSSPGLFLFCSPACRNKARAIPQVPCPICGSMFTASERRKTYCSQECARTAQIGSTVKTHSEIKEIIRKQYQDLGADALSKLLNIPLVTIRTMANNMRVPLTKEAYHRIVHDAAKKYMLENNPMKNEIAVQKNKEWWEKHPDEKERVQNLLFAGHQKLQKRNPSKLEIKLRQYLDQLNIDYESSATIKPNFVVDIKIGNLIIEADGDYWHGHPRFEPLTDRQRNQKRRDESRNKYLAACGYSVVRIWESEMTKELVEKELRNNGILQD